MDNEDLKLLEEELNSSFRSVNESVDASFQVQMNPVDGQDQQMMEMMVRMPSDLDNVWDPDDPLGLLMMDRIHSGAAAAAEHSFDDEHIYEHEAEEAVQSPLGDNQLELDQMRALENLTMDGDDLYERSEQPTFPRCPPPIALPSGLTTPSSPLTMLDTFHRHTPLPVPPPVSAVADHDQIRREIEQEFQIRELQLRKELLEDKERQLQLIRQEMHLMSQQQPKLPSLTVAATQTAMPEVCDKAVEASNNSGDQVQGQMTNEMLRKMTAEYEQRESEMKLTIAQRDVQLSASENDLMRARDEIESLKMKLQKQQRKLKQLPDPLNALTDAENRENEVRQVQRKEEEKYRDAYNQAIDHLKQSYTALTHKMRQQSIRAQEEAVLQVRMEFEQKLHERDAELLTERSQKQLIQTQLEDLQEQLGEQRRSSGRQMEAIKEQYLQTLKQMRDDVALSKARSVERVREAWTRKREELERVWLQRFEELKSEYEQRLQSHSSAQKSKKIVYN